MIKCGVLGSGGYLGSQLKEFIKLSSFEKYITIYEYDRNASNFKKNNFSELDILLNFGSPNETLSRDVTKNKKQIILEWKFHVDNIVNNYNPKKIIHISTVTVFNNNENKINENSKIFSTDPYGILHIKCLDILKIICNKKNIEIINLFPSNVYGTLKKGLRLRDTLILNKMILSSIEGKNIELNSKCNSYRDFMWIEDFMFIILQILKNYRDINHSKIIISTGDSINIKNAVNFVFNNLKMNSNQSIIFGKIEDDSNKIIYENFLIKKIFPNWTPISIENAILKLKSIYK